MPNQTQPQRAREESQSPSPRSQTGASLRGHPLATTGHPSRVMEPQMKVPTVDTEHRQIPAMGHQTRGLVTAMERPQTPVMEHQRKAPTLTALQHLVATGPQMKAQMMATGHPPKVLTLTVHLHLVAMKLHLHPAGILLLLPHLHLVVMKLLHLQPQ